LAENEPLEPALGIRATTLMQFGRVEVAEADLDPSIGTASGTDAEAVSIAHIAHHPAKGRIPGGEWPFARVGERRCCKEEEWKGKHCSSKS